MVGKHVQKIDLLKKLDINVISIKRKKTSIDDQGAPRIEEVMLQPSHLTILEKEDVMVVIARNEDIDSLQGK
jgi:Trk K+ transport system NAD-binding subunit